MDLLATPHKRGVTIAIATFMRPDGLRRALEQLAQLSRPADMVVDLVVVDNDREGSGVAVCKAFLEAFPFEWTCIVEPKRGISHARNRAIDHAVERDSAFLVFIDDDEIPEPMWLCELLKAQAAKHADMVGGPVIGILPASAAAWIVNGGFFASKPVPDGSPVDEVYTGNVLISARVFRQLGLRFDDRFALSGGEDMDYSRCARRAGMSLVWAANAVVSEPVPASRLNAKWLFRRRYRGALTFVRHQLKFSSWLEVAVRNVFLGTGHICYGLLGMTVRIWGPFSGTMKCLLRIAFGLGLWAGVLGLDCMEYAGTHGRRQVRIK